MKRIQTNEKVISKTFGKSAMVMVAGSVTAFIGTTVDSIVTSRMLGVEYVSSFQLVQPLILIVTMIASLIYSGLQNVYAKQIGAGKIKEAHSVMSLSLVILGGISILCGAVYCIFAHPIVSGFGAADASSILHREAVGYIYGISPGLIGLCIQMVFSYVIMMEGRQNVVMAAVVVQTAVNITGDILVATVFHSGLFGMGLASTICYYSALLVFLISALRRPISYKFRLAGLKIRSLLEVFKMGMPGAAERAYLVLQTLFLNTILLSRISAQAVAAYAILSTLNNLLQSVATGTAGTVFTMASVYVGDKDSNSLKITLRSAMRFTVLLEGAMLVIVMITAHWLILPFIGTDGAEVQEMATFALRALALSMPFYGIIHTFQRYVQAVGAMKMAYIIPALDSVIFFIPSALILLAAAGGSGIWFAFLAGEMIAFFAITIITSIKVKHPAFKFEDYLYFPPSIQVDESDIVDESVEDVTALIGFSEQCRDYCLEKSGDSRKAMLIALVIEEMGGNIFRFNEKKVTVDVRLLKKDDTWVLRIRDNGVAFDPTAWMKIHQTVDKEKNIGIRMIAGLADRFEYISIMSMNNLIIHIKTQEDN